MKISRPLIAEVNVPAAAAAFSDLRPMSIDTLHRAAPIPSAALFYVLYAKYSLLV